jgi:metal-responsive CopG/Arc/MetJ family transcriptional regulator
MTSAYPHHKAKSSVMQIRIQPELIARVDRWAISESVPSRSEAIRTLMEFGLDQKETENKSGPALERQTADNIPHGK